MLRLCGIAPALLLSALATGCGGGSSQDDDDVPEVLSPDGENEDASGPLTKSVLVFGVAVRATAGVADDRILHAAQVLAEYLDNDEDGNPDNPAVVEQMTARGATLVVVVDEEELESIAGLVEFTDAWQDLRVDEMFPDGRAEGRFDATLEEVLHLVTHVGYANEYPTLFGEVVGSLLADAMDVARGGRFLSVPEQYPEEAWYTYYDQTCDYACQVTEYIYWALTSVLGGQDYPGRLEEIRDEWRLNTHELVREADTRVYSLITDPQYGWPTVLPDGDYAGETFAVEQT